jgi:hypothetical protein
MYASSYGHTIIFTTLNIIIIVFILLIIKMPKKFAIKPRTGFGGSRGATKNFESRGGAKRKSDDTSGQGAIQEAESVSSYEVSS